MPCLPQIWQVLIAMYILSRAYPGSSVLTALVTVNPSLTLADYQQLYAHPGVNPQLTAIATQLANGDTTKITVAMQPVDHTTAVENIVSKVRAIHAPGGLVPLVDGVTAYQIDLLASLRATLPYALLVIIVSGFSTPLFNDRLVVDADQGNCSQHTLPLSDFWRIGMDFPGWSLAECCWASSQSVVLTQHNQF